MSTNTQNAAFYRKASKVLLEVHVLSFYLNVVLSTAMLGKEQVFGHGGYVDVAQAFIVFVGIKPPINHTVVSNKRT